MSASLPALRAYLGAQSAFRRNDYTAAIRQYETALTRDSTFALAALRLAIAADRVDDASRVRRGLHVAWSYRTELAERDHAMLLSLAGARYPAPPLAREQIEAWERSSDLAPSSAEAWFALGARLFHDGTVADVENSRERARSALERALVADTNYAPAARLLAHLDLESNRTVALAVDDSLVPLAPFLRWRTAASRNDTAVLRTIRDGFVRLGPTNLRAIAMASQFDAVGLSDGALAIQALLARTNPRARPADLVLADHSMALNQGRTNDALEATDELRASLPASHAYLRLRVLDALYGEGDSSAARAAAEELERTTASTGDTTNQSDTRFADICVVGQWRLAAGNFAAVPGIVADLRATTSVEREPVSAEPAACADLLEASVAVAGRHRDARARLARLDSLAITTAVASDAAVYAPLLIARLHERMGDTRRALAAIRRRQYMSDWPRYLASMLREEIRLASAARDTEGASRAQRRYVMFRPRADTP